jgi:hypothetical protein
MEKKQPKNKGGRPRIKLDVEQIEKLASIGCTTQEIGVVLGCSDNTLERNYMQVLELGRAKMRMSLRRMQIKAAQEGNGTMMVWLGKQYLDQADKSENKVYASSLTDILEGLDEKLSAAQSVGVDSATLARKSRSVRH